MEANNNQNNGGFRITKDVPLWGILTVLGSIASAFVTLYFGQQNLIEEVKRTNQQQDKIAVDVRTIASDTQKINLEAVRLSFQVGALEQRIRAAEQAQQQSQSQGQQLLQKPR